MKILIDECLPKRLKSYLDEFDVYTASEMGWSSLKNGNLLSEAIAANFDIMLTADKQIQHQQNMNKYDMAIVIFDVKRNKIEMLVPLLPILKLEISTYQKGNIYTVK